MFSFNKKKTTLESVEKEVLEISEISKDDRLFFHDIINQTHGLLLYLGQKELSGESIHPDDVKMMTSEIKTLQSLIRDHFSFKHKNLVQTFDWVSFNQLKLSFLHMTETYLSDTKVELSFKIEEGANGEELFYYPCFYRILNNLIKNIAESKTLEVEFNFVLTSTGLFLNTKNQMKRTKENELPEYLSQVILNEKSSFQSLGLESVHHLAEENGGTFSFEIFDHIWINHLFLPSKKEAIHKSPTKIPA